jgi:EAL domain-containing protein (putative c-di-GMP-specific phosphodiesterase class I)
MNCSMEEDYVPATLHFSLQQAHAGGVLLVARDKAAAATVSRALGALSATVTIVDSATAALAQIRRASYDAVFCDADLAETAALDLVATVRAYAPATPIILLTESTTEPSRPTLPSLSVTRMAKPLNAAQWATTLRRMGAVRRTSGVAQVSVRRSPFDDAVDALFVELEPVVDMRTGTSLGFEARLGSRVDGLQTHTALFECAHGLRRRTELMTQFFEILARTFAQAPEDALLFVETADDLSAYLDPSVVCPESLLDRVVLVVPSAERVDALRAAGYRIAIAHDAPGADAVRPDFVRIRGDVIRGVNGDREQLAAAERAVAHFAQLGAVAIASGVTTAEEQAALRSVGCYLAQGPLHRRRALRSSLAPTVGCGLFDVRLRRVASP